GARAGEGGQHVCAQQGVHQRALARLELAHHHDLEALGGNPLAEALETPTRTGLECAGHRGRLLHDPTELALLLLRARKRVGVVVNGHEGPPSGSRASANTCWAAVATWV